MFPALEPAASTPGAAGPGRKMAAAAEGGAGPREEPGEPAGTGGDIDTNSDETVVEGSVAESDVEEEEFCRRRW